jgi:uncharacterized protein (TIGR03790 family)
MAERTLVLFNPDFPGSREVALYYAERRGIPSEQVVGLPCSGSETIDRATFEQSIREPLWELFKERGWWAGEGESPGSRHIRIICPVFGMPLRVSGMDGEAPGAVARISAASIDSELTLLGVEGPVPGGPVPNPYFRKNFSFAELAEYRMMLVSRLDGPSQEVVRGMIDGALEAERDGLWGRAYIDFAADGRSGAELGDGWLKEAARSLWSAGIPVVEDPHASRFPAAYPMRDAVCYFGWYTDRADGPFTIPSFRMRPGAVACHMHSFSAETVRDTGRRWAAPLLARGAAVVLGNVDEPFLQLMTYPDLFVDRLLRGYCVAEAAWMATPVLSWMSTVLGDPLYRPFGYASRNASAAGQAERQDRNAGYRAIEVATLGGGDAELLRSRLEQAIETAATGAQRGVVTEALGLHVLAGGDEQAAVARFQRARDLFDTDADRVRMHLHEIDVLRRTGNLDQAEEQLRGLLTSLGANPLAQAAEALLLQLDPPAPNFPLPSRPLPFAP